MRGLTDAELDDIQQDAESTARLVGAPGSPVRQRASATVRLVEEVRRLRSLCLEVADVVDAIIDSHVCKAPAIVTDSHRRARDAGVSGCVCSRDRDASVVRLRAAGGES